MVKPIVSVIIPAYNCANYIEKTIDSVLNQHISLEIIIVSDCSEDNLDQVLEKYLKLENITYLKNKSNLGVAESRNRGVRVARGEYIAYLDADDWWKSDKLTKQIKFMEEKQCILCYTARELVKEDETPTGKVIHVKDEIDYNGLLNHNSIACSSVVIKREIAIACPMSHSELHEDYITWLTILKKYGKACGIDEPLLIYRLSKNGKSRKKLKSARMTYGVYRVMEFGRAKALILMGSHIIHGLVKYSKKG